MLEHIEHVNINVVIVTQNKKIMKVYRYEDSIESVENIEKPSIFLAGPTVRGHQPYLTSWRHEVIEKVKDWGHKVDLIVPEFISPLTSDKGVKRCPIWEFAGLQKADCILFWIPRTRDKLVDGKIQTGLIALTTNMEFGYWQGRQPDKMIYGRPNDAYRMSYLDIMWKAVYDEQRSKTYNPCIYDTLENTISASITKAIKRHIK